VFSISSTPRIPGIAFGSCRKRSFDAVLHSPAVRRRLLCFSTLSQPRTDDRILGRPAASACRHPRQSNRPSAARIVIFYPLHAADIIWPTFNVRASMTMRRLLAYDLIIAAGRVGSMAPDFCLLLLCTRTFFRIGNFPINTYGVFLALAFLAAYCCHEASARDGLPRERIYDFVSGCCGFIVGSRFSCSLPSRSMRASGELSL